MSSRRYNDGFSRLRGECKFSSQMPTAGGVQALSRSNCAPPSPPVHDLVVPPLEEVAQLAGPAEHHGSHLSPDADALLGPHALVPLGKANLALAADDQKKLDLRMGQPKRERGDRVACGRRLACSRGCGLCRGCKASSRVQAGMPDRSSCSGLAAQAGAGKLTIPRLLPQRPVSGREWAGSRLSKRRKYVPQSANIGSIAALALPARKSQGNTACAARLR